MPATTTRLINRIWGEYYSNYSPEDSKESDTCAMKEDEIEEQDEGEEDEEEDEEEKGSVGGSVLSTGDSEEYPPIYFVEYMFEELDGRKVVHGRLLMRGYQTVLGNTTNEREVFMTNDCLESMLHGLGCGYRVRVCI